MTSEYSLSGSMYFFLPVDKKTVSLKKVEVVLTDRPSAVCLTEANPSVIAGREL